MRMSYRRTIVIKLGRDETKLWIASEAYKIEIQQTMKDLANKRNMPVELELSSFRKAPRSLLTVDKIEPSQGGMS